MWHDVSYGRLLHKYSRNVLGPREAFSPVGKNINDNNRYEHEVTRQRHENTNLPSRRNQILVSSILHTQIHAVAKDGVTFAVDRELNLLGITGLRQ